MESSSSQVHESGSSQGSLGSGPPAGSKTARRVTVKRPMNSFLIFCKRHRALVHERNPNVDNRSVTRMLGDMWKGIQPEDRAAYENLSKQNKDAFYKANPDFKWRQTDPAPGLLSGEASTARSDSLLSPVNTASESSDNLQLHDSDTPHSHILLDNADPSRLTSDGLRMGGLNLLIMAGRQSLSSPSNALSSDPYDVPVLCSSLERGRVDSKEPKDAIVVGAADVKKRKKRVAATGSNDDVKIRKKRRTKKSTTQDGAALPPSASQPHQFIYDQVSSDSSPAKEVLIKRSGSVDLPTDNKFDVFPSAENQTDNNESAQKRLYQLKLVPVLQNSDQQQLGLSAEQQNAQQQLNLLLQHALKMQPYQLLYQNTPEQQVQQINNVQQQLAKQSQLQVNKPEQKLELGSGQQQQLSSQLLQSNTTQLLQEQIRLIQQKFQLQNLQGEQMLQMQNQQQQLLQQQQQQQQQNEQLRQYQQQQGQELLALAFQQLTGKVSGSGRAEISSSLSVSNVSDFSNSIRKPWLDSSVSYASKNYMLSSSNETNSRISKAVDHSTNQNADVSFISNRIISDMSASISRPASATLNTGISVARSSESNRFLLVPKQSTANAINSSSIVTLASNYLAHLFAKPVDLGSAVSSVHSSGVDLRQTTLPGSSLSTIAGTGKLSEFASSGGREPFFQSQTTGHHRVVSDTEQQKSAQRNDVSNVNKRLLEMVIEAAYSQDAQQEQLQRLSSETVRSFPKTKKQQAVSKTVKSSTTCRETLSDAGSERSTDSGSHVVATEKWVMQSRGRLLEGVAVDRTSSNLTYGQIQDRLIRDVVERPQILLGEDMRHSGLNNLTQECATNAIKAEMSVIENNKYYCAVDSLRPASNSSGGGRNLVADSMLGLQPYRVRTDKGFNDLVKLTTAAPTINQSSTVPLSRDSSHSAPVDCGGMQLSVHRIIEDLIAQSHAAFPQKQQCSETVSHPVLVGAQVSLNQRGTSLITAPAKICDTHQLTESTAISKNNAARNLNEKPVAKRKYCKANNIMHNDGSSNNATDHTNPIKKRKKKNDVELLGELVLMNRRVESKEEMPNHFKHVRNWQILEEMREKTVQHVSDAPTVYNQYTSEHLSTDFVINEENHFDPNSLETRNKSACDNFDNEGTDTVVMTTEEEVKDEEEEVKEEVNNNHSNETGNDASTTTVVKAWEQAGVRKSKRCNRAKKYNELVSQGVLHTSKKRLDASFCEENEENAECNDDQLRSGSFDSCGQSSGSRQIGGLDAVHDAEVDPARRYKSGDFDLEAHIASLPVCLFDVADKKPVAKIKMRSGSNATGCLRTSTGGVDLTAATLEEQPSRAAAQWTSGTSAEVVRYIRLQSKRPMRRLVGSNRKRKARVIPIFRCLPLSLVPTADKQLKSSAPVRASLSHCTSQTVSSRHNNKTSSNKHIVPTSCAESDYLSSPNMTSRVNQTVSNLAAASGSMTTRSGSHASSSDLLTLADIADTLRH